MNCRKKWKEEKEEEDARTDAIKEKEEEEEEDPPLSFPPPLHDLFFWSTREGRPGRKWFEILRRTEPQRKRGQV